MSSFDTSDHSESLIGAKRSHSSLDELLRRNDVWRGHSQVFVPQASIDTGHPTLNSALIHKGWPEACLVELGQSNAAGTWLLFSHAARSVSGMDLGLGLAPGSDVRSGFSGAASKPDEGGVIVLLNPPAAPYAVGLLRLGIPLERVWIITPQNKADFIACFVELARSPACRMLMSWQPKQRLSYTELRKCQLATHERAGLYVLFRHESALTQSSPAALRIRVVVSEQHLELEFLKQKGKVPNAKVLLSLPDYWFSSGPYKSLDQSDLSHANNKLSSLRAAARSASVIELNRSKSKR